MSGSIAAGLLGLLPALAHAQGATTQVRPYFLVIVDTSGSMNAETGSGTNSCGYDRTRLNDAKCVLRRLASSVGEITFGLARFHADSCSNTTRPSGCATSNGHGEYGNCVSPCGGSGSCNNTCWGETSSNSVCGLLGITDCRERRYDAADILVGINDESANEVLFWTDHTCNFPTNPELDVSNWTPIGGSLGTAFRYFSGELAAGVPGRHAAMPSPIAGDPYAGCRPYRVIMLTDGDETCGNNTTQVADIARSLRAPSVPGGHFTFGGNPYDIQSYFIGFGISPGDADIEAYATAGGTDAPGANRGFYATDEASLALAFSQIISESVLVEVCDNADNNCNGVVDEGFQKYCDRDGRMGAATSSSVYCTDPGDDCDMSDDNCFMGTTDEPRNLCGTCGSVTEICNLIDDDCDGAVDEGGVCDGCVFEPESCDGIDNDCDDCVDGTSVAGGPCMPLTRECGGAIGVCTPGVESCVDGEWVGCTGVTPSPEMCNNLDDDCDGVVDGFSEDCGMTDEGVCQLGTRLCIAGMFGECIGEIGPSEEICDGLDNDCDGEVDEGNPGGGAECGGGMGSCSIGTLVCMEGALVCMGGVSPEPEMCDGIDNDCNGLIDDGIPSSGPCGTDEGACMVGMNECVGGRFTCVGATEAAPEICNCVDDDCDGEVDEETTGESLCPTGRCVACQCAQPCSMDEFPCAVGRRCVDMDNAECNPPRLDCVCVGDPCATVDCPDMNDEGERIVCQAGVCVPICDTVSCGGTQVCRPGDGRCVDNSCRFLPCGTGRYCDETMGTCQTDLCASGGVTCSGAGEVCNPATGTCTTDDLCTSVMCPPDSFCRNGDCYPGGTDAGIPPPPPRDSGPGGRTDGGTTQPDRQDRGLASGGGGLICAAGGAPGSGSGSLAALAALLVLGLALISRGFRGGIGR